MHSCMTGIYREGSRAHAHTDNFLEQAPNGVHHFSRNYTQLYTFTVDYN